MYLSVHCDILIFSVAAVCLLAIPHFEKTGDFSYPLPNMLNVSFYPAVFLKMALIIVPLSMQTLTSWNNTLVIAQEK